MPAEKYGESQGIKDIKSFTDSKFEKIPPEEISDEESESYITALRLDSEGSKVFNVLESSAYISQQAYLRDAQDGDSNVIYVKNQKETVTTEGDCTVTDVDGGGKKYTFDVGATGYNKSTCSTSGIPDCGSGSARFEITPNGANSIKVVAYKSSGGVASTQYWSGYAGSAIITYVVSTGPTASGGGSVTVMPSTYSGKTLVPAVLKKEKTKELHYAPWRYIPSEKTESDPVTILAQSGSTAVQNFAFDGMEDYE